MEKWKTVKRDTRYEVSSYGNVRHRKNKQNRMFRVTHNGYLDMNVSHPDNPYKTKKHRVHLLVAEAFLDNFDPNKVIDHIDFNKQNNRVDNLRCITQKKNIAHSFNHNKKHYGTQIGARKLSDSQLLKLRAMLSFDSLKEKDFRKIAYNFACSSNTIREIYNGKKYLYLKSFFETSTAIPTGSTLK